VRLAGTGRRPPIEEDPMTTHTSAPTRSRPGLRPDPTTLAGAVLALACTVVGQYVETPWKSDSDGWGVDFAGAGGFGALALLVGLVVIAAAVVSAVVGPARAAEATTAARRAAWLAVVGVLSLAVFWSGLPPVLAAGAAGLAVHSRRGLDRTPVAAAVALVLAVLTIAAAVFLALAG
jgi:hypothetical protein